jgi:hypothetical protein
VDEYLCVTVRSQPGETEADFKARLSRFWTHMLRNRKPDFEKIYAETTAFEKEGGRLTRKYLVREEVVAVLEPEMAVAAVEHGPIDRDEVYTKYEAVSPEWMQVEH